MEHASTVIAVIIVVALIALGIWMYLKFSLRRRLDYQSHNSHPEMREGYREIQRDIDRGKSAAQGFFPL